MNTISHQQLQRRGVQQLFQHRAASYMVKCTDAIEGYDHQIRVAVSERAESLSDGISASTGLQGELEGRGG